MIVTQEYNLDQFTKLSDNLYMFTYEFSNSMVLSTLKYASVPVYYKNHTGRMRFLESMPWSKIKQTKGFKEYVTKNPELFI